jgi:hypothetical protein
MAAITTRLSSGSVNGTGTISTSTSSATVTGSGTLFTTEVVVGQVLKSGGSAVGTVLVITSNTSITLSGNSNLNLTTAAYTITTPGVTLKGSPLSSLEIDANFINLNNSFLTVSSGATHLNIPSTIIKRDVDGSFYAGAVYVTSLTESSSIKLKSNINPITGALSSILSLNGVTYDRKDNSVKNEAGLIAEEVESILPNIVAKDATGEPIGINYTKLTAYVIEAIKELKQEIDTLKSGSPAPEPKKSKKWLF